MSFFTASFGTILVGCIIDRYGRRSAILFSIVPNLVGWFLLYLDKNTVTLLTGRALTGLCTGSMYYPSQVYIAECIAVNHPHLRDSFVLWASTVNGLGELLIYLLGYGFEYTELCAVATFMSFFSLLLVYFFIPESPSWLFLQNRINDAQWAERKLGIYQPILHDPKMDVQSIPQPVPHQTKWSEVKLAIIQLKRKDIYKPVIITTVLIVLMKFTGSVVLTTYLVDIMSGACSAQDTKSYTYSMISQLLVTVATFLSGFVIPMFGIKRVSAVAVAGAFVGVTTLVTSSSTAVTEHVLPLHVIGVWLAMFMFHFGVANVSRAIISEAFPIDAKGYASIPMVMLNIAGATTLKLHPYLALRFGGNVYYGYAACTLLYGFYVHSFLPETVGKSLDEINKELS